MRNVVSTQIPGARLGSTPAGCFGHDRFSYANCSAFMLEKSNPFGSKIAARDQPDWPSCNRPTTHCQRLARGYATTSPSRY